MIDSFSIQGFVKWASSSYYILSLGPTSYLTFAGWGESSFFYTIIYGDGQMLGKFSNNLV